MLQIIFITEFIQQYIATAQISINSMFILNTAIFVVFLQNFCVISLSSNSLNCALHTILSISSGARYTTNKIYGSWIAQTHSGASPMSLTHRSKYCPKWQFVSFIYNLTKLEHWIYLKYPANKIDSIVKSKTVGHPLKFRKVMCSF